MMGLQGNKRWYPVMLALLLAAGLIAAGTAAGRRYAVEADNRQVELAMPYPELRQLAGLTGKQPAEIMKLFREQGLTAVFFPELTGEDIQKSGEFVVLSGQEVFFFRQTGGALGVWLGELLREGKISADDTIFVTGAQNSALRLAGQLKIKAANVRLFSRPGEGGAASGGTGDAAAEKGLSFGTGIYLVCTATDPGTLAGLGLGFPAGPLGESERAGLRAIVQLRGWPGATRTGLEQLFQPLRKIPNLSAIAFYGGAVPGYPQLLPEVAENIQKLGVPTVQIEFHPQKGLAVLGALLNQQVLRLHSADPEELKITSFASLRDRFILAAAERNVRILLVYPVIEPGAGDCLAQNLAYVGALKKDLEQKGLSVGPAQPFAPLAPPRFLLFLIGLGVLAGGLELLRQMGLTRFYLPIGLAAGAAFAGLTAAAPQTGAKSAALAAAVIFPALAVLGALQPSGTTVPRSVLLLLRTTLVTLAGALLITGLLADTRYMLTLDRFTGVKAAYLLPLVFLTVIFIWRDLARRGRPGAVTAAFRVLCSRLGNQPVLLKWVAAGLFLIVVLGVYLLRTGTQEVIPPSALELKFRSLLDHLLVVRPRTKEFLIGHPFLLLLFYTGYRDNRFLPLLLLGAIGQISVVNTFCHLHTPLAVSVLRTFHGIWLGVSIGLLLIVGWNLIFCREDGKSGNDG